MWGGELAGLSGGLIEKNLIIWVVFKVTKAGVFLEPQTEAGVVGRGCMVEVGDDLIGLIPVGVEGREVVVCAKIILVQVQGGG